MLDSPSYLSATGPPLAGGAARRRRVARPRLHDLRQRRPRLPGLPLAEMGVLAGHRRLLRPHLARRSAPRIALLDRKPGRVPDQKATLAEVGWPSEDSCRDRSLSPGSPRSRLSTSCRCRPLCTARRRRASDLEKRARAIHERVIALDTHDDINPANFTAERNYTQDLQTQVNLPKMMKGGLDASFFIVYVGQGDAHAGRLRRCLQAGDREVRGDPPPDQGDRARQDRAGADRRRRDADRRRRARRSRSSASRTPIRIGTDLEPHQGVLRSRRPLHVAGAQRPQPVLRLEHRRARRQVAAQRPQRARQARRSPR